MSGKSYNIHARSVDSWRIRCSISPSRLYVLDLFYHVLLFLWGTCTREQEQHKNSGSRLIYHTYTLSPSQISTMIVSCLCLAFDCPKSSPKSGTGLEVSDAPKKTDLRVNFGTRYIYYWFLSGVSSWLKLFGWIGQKRKPHVPLWPLYIWDLYCILNTIY